MKFSTVLYQMNLHKEKYRQLFRVGKRFVRETELYQQMKNNPEFNLHDANEVVAETFLLNHTLKPARGIRVKPPVLGEDHPDYHETPCLMYRDMNVLTEGLDQAKVLTNTIEIQEGLPEHLSSSGNDQIVEQETEMIHLALASAVVYNTTMELLPRRFNPQKPMFSYPRDYGIPSYRKNYTLCHRFLHLCELLAGLDISNNRYKLENALFSVPLTRPDSTTPIMLQLRSDHLLFSNEPLQPICDPKNTIGIDLPDLTPLKYTISLEEDHFYRLENIFPLKTGINSPRIHTAFVHFNTTEVRNLYKEPVTEYQTLGRSLMKAFTIAAAEARHIYGEDVEILPEPIVIQCIQTDSQNCHLCIFQLNTLAWPPTNDGIRNVFWSEPIMSMYEYGGYFEGKPTITSFNPDVFKKIFSFYMNA